MTTPLAELNFFHGTRAELVESFALQRNEPAVVATLNLQHLALMQKSPDVDAAIRRCELVTADGAPVAWIARLMGLGPERVAGADMVEDLLTVSGRGLRVYLLGADWRTLRRAARLFRESGVRIVGYYSPRPSEVASEERSIEIAACIRATRPNLVLLFLGTPKQELWADRYKTHVGPCTIIGAGAGLDFLMGNKRRSPMILQRMGLEWLFRLACEPRRLWRRYLVEYLGAVRPLARAFKETRSGLGARRELADPQSTQISVPKGKARRRAA